MFSIRIWSVVLAAAVLISCSDDPAQSPADAGISTPTHPDAALAEDTGVFEEDAHAPPDWSSL